MERKESFLEKILHKGKVWATSILLMTSSQVAQAQNTPFQQTSSKEHKSEQLANAKPTIETKLKRMEKELIESTFTQYKGLTINLDSIQPQEVAHVFESTLNPCITDGNRPIQSAQYLGLCQMAINSTLPNFIEQRCKDSEHFKSLYTFKKNKTIRSQKFMNEWRRLSLGAHAAEFEKEQFEFMFDIAYKQVFDKLSATGYFPEITLDNCASPENFVYSAAVMSCVNQNPKRTDEIFLRTFNNICIKALKENKIKYASSFNPHVKDYKARMKVLMADLHKNIALIEKNNIEIDDGYTNISLETYETKKTAFGKMGGRYDQEKRLLEEINNRMAKQAAYKRLSANPLLAQSTEETRDEKTSYDFYKHIDMSKLKISDELSNARELLILLNNKSKLTVVSQKGKTRPLPSSRKQHPLTLNEVRRQRMISSKKERV